MRPRAGSTTAFYNGGITGQNCAADATLNAIGWYCGNANGTTHPSGEKTANAWGLYDMSGNVAEWVWGSLGDYPGTVSDPTAAGEGGEGRVLRGGAFSHNVQFARSASRDAAEPAELNSNVGFRLVRSLP